MRNTRWVKTAALVFACLLAGGLFCACAKDSKDEPTPQEQNRAYMAQVNQLADDLRESFGEFIDAVSRNDLIAMKAKADEAFKSIDKLEQLEAPEGLEDVQSAYAQGAASLRTALQGYVDLYAELEAAQDTEDFDLSGYESRLAEIQASYDEGLKALGEGDQLASEKE